MLVYRTVIVVVLALLRTAHGGFLRIVNGTDANITEFPYMASLRSYYTDTEEIHVCGGSIIARKWILTAGHCLSQNITSARVGHTDLDDFSTNHTFSVPALRTVLYPNYTEELNAINDLALVELATPLNFSSTIKPVSLPQVNATTPFNSLAWIAGWGMINESTYEPSDILQKVQITVFSDAYCLQTIGEDYSVGQNLCAGNINNTKGHCSGDSGGPLVINGIQWGIISWSIKPCISAPGVYTSLTNPSYRKWISSVAGV
ncbi:serine protease 33-like isoform X2 [Rhynchophorus ferrugineus]|uniref:serine protease 33-like isoform X2 n=1 Tax=Rhynchophorus ferrugineus TaxID=354439 RepID=UPI003FCE20B7